MPKHRWKYLHIALVLLLLMGVQGQYFGLWSTSVAKSKSPQKGKASKAQKAVVFHAQIQRLKQSMKKRQTPEAATSLGRLLALSGHHQAAEKAWKHARKLWAAGGAKLKMGLFRGSSVEQMTWGETTLGVLRILWGTKNTGTSWYELALWDKPKDTLSAPRLRLTSTRRGGSFAWAGPRHLWWHGREELLFVDALSGRILRRVKTGRKANNQDRFSSHIAVATKSGHVAAIVGTQIVRVWTQKGKLVRTVTLQGTTSTMIRANTGEGCIMRQVQTPVVPLRVALSPQGRFLAIGTNDTKVRLTKTSRGSVKKLQQVFVRSGYSSPRNPIYQGRPIVLQFSGNGRYLRLLQSDTSVTTWRTSTGKRTHRWSPPCAQKPATKLRHERVGCPIRHGDLSAKGHRFVTASRRVALYTLPQGASLPAPKISYPGVVALNHRYGVLAVHNEYDGNTTELWSLRKPRRIRSLTQPRRAGKIAAISHNGRYVAICHAEKSLTLKAMRKSWKRGTKVSVWDLVRNRRIGQLRTSGCGSLRFTPDGRGLVVGFQKRLEFWSLLPWQPGKQMRLASYTMRAVLAMAPRRPVVAYSSSFDKHIRTWNYKTGKVTLLSPPFTATRMQWNKTGTHLTSVGPTGVRVWRISDQKAIAHFPPRTLRLPLPKYHWRYRQAKNRSRTLTELVTIHPKVAVVSPDQKLVAIVERQPRSIRLLALKSGRLLASLPLANSPEWLLFTPKGKELLVGGIGIFGRWRWGSPGTPKLLPFVPNGRAVHSERAHFGQGGKTLFAFESGNGTIELLAYPQGRLLARLWPVSGGHWAALSSAGKVDASLRGRAMFRTIVRSPKSVQLRGSGMGWARYAQPGLFPSLIKGQNSTK